MTDTTMQAAQYDRYGEPDVLQVRTVPIPTPGSGQILVRVHGSSVNLADAQVRAGRMRMISGRRFPKGTGVDFAGEVARIGPGVSGITPGQKVWGDLGGLPGPTGTAADYVIVKQDRVSAAPVSIGQVTAAALPAVGLAALQTLRDTVGLQAGQRLLVIGASGGVGNTTVQLARAMGASVTAVTSARNAEFCRKIGADHVLDYATFRPDVHGCDFDVMVDCHGASPRQYHQMLHRRGRAATVVTRAIPFALLSLVRPGPRVRIVVAKARSGDLATLVEYVDSGALRPAVERVYPLTDIDHAHRAIESGHAQGKRVLDLTER